MSKENHLQLLEGILGELVGTIANVTICRNNVIKLKKQMPRKSRKRKKIIAIIIILLLSSIL